MISEYEGGINLQNEMWGVNLEVQGGKNDRRKGRAKRYKLRKDGGAEELSCQVSSEGNKKMR